MAAIAQFPLAAEISPTAHRIQNPASGRQKPRRSPPSSETPDYQEQIPVFLKLQDGEEDQKGSADDSQPPSSANPSGRHKSPSAGSIPQFPEPSTSSTVPPVPPKRSLNLGPPLQADEGHLHIIHITHSSRLFQKRTLGQLDHMHQVQQFRDMILGVYLTSQQPDRGGWQRIL
uniref:Uncharacterized protein n=1 Tax=Bionectria ochroleuca TaxID=29856 RepID=A0A8H7NJL5_BIOOC